MENRTYPAGKGAKLSLTVAGILCCLLIVTIPLGIWFIVRGRAGRVVLDDAGLDYKLLGRVRVAWSEVERIGLLRIKIKGHDIGKELARRKVGGNESVNLCLRLAGGRTKHFIASQFEDWETMLDAVRARTGLEMEKCTRGAMGPKWPERG